MKLILPFVLVLVGLGIAAGADPPKPAPKVGGPVFPDPQPAPQPPPKPVLQSLSLGFQYVITSDAECTVVASPDGIVDIAADTTPISIGGLFVGGTGKHETRTYAAGTFCYVVTPAATGKVELIVVSGGKTSRRCLDVSAGPPVPPNPPTPPTPTDPLTMALQAAYDAETDTAKAAKIGKLVDNFNAIPAVRASGTVTTLAQFQAVMYTAEDLSTGVGGLPGVRKAISGYVAGKMPSTDGPMTDQLWLTATAAYGDVAKALKGVK